MIKFRLIPAEIELNYLQNIYTVDIGHICVGTDTFEFTGSLFYISFFEALAI